MVESQVHDVALELLKKMDEHQAKGSEEAVVNPYEVARHVEGLGYRGREFVVTNFLDVYFVNCNCGDALICSGV